MVAFPSPPSFVCTRVGTFIWACSDLGFPYPLVLSTLMTFRALMNSVISSGDSAFNSVSTCYMGAGNVPWELPVPALTENPSAPTVRLGFLLSICLLVWLGTYS